MTKYVKLSYFKYIYNYLEPFNNLYLFIKLLLETMDMKLSHHKHYSSRQVNTLDKDLKHKTQFKIRY